MTGNWWLRGQLEIDRMKETQKRWKEGERCHFISVSYIGGGVSLGYLRSAAGHGERHWGMVCRTLDQEPAAFGSEISTASHSCASLNSSSPLFLH